MPKFVVTQTVEFEVTCLIEAKNEEDAYDNFGTYFDRNKIIDVELSSYDPPWNITAAEDSEEFEFVSQEVLEPYIRVRIV
jgi:hypothetical protein